MRQLRIPEAGVHALALTEVLIEAPTAEVIEAEFGAGDVIG